MEPFWLDLVKTVGVPSAFLLALLAAVWQGVKWSANHMALPALNKHLLFLDQVARAVERISHVQEEIVANQLLCTELQKKLCDSINRLQCQQGAP